VTVNEFRNSVQVTLLRCDAMYKGQSGKLSQCSVFSVLERIVQM